MTRSGDLLDFGQLLNAFGNTLFAQISHILKEFCKVVKIYHFYRHLAIFSGHTGRKVQSCSLQ